MFKNYVKTAWRNLQRNRVFSFINIAGLVISLTAFVLMALYIEDELSFDKFNKNANRIYRVADDKQTPDVLLQSAASAAPVAPALVRDFPEIQNSVRLIDAEALMKYNNKIFEERRIYFSDESIFSIFSFPLIEGSREHALSEPGSIVLTADMSRKYFGQEDAIGKIITLDGKNMKVTGIMENLPANSQLQFDCLISMSTAKQKNSGYDWLFDNWYSNNFYTYILLPENYDVKRLTNRLADFDNRHHEAGDNTVHHYALEKLSSIYLHSNREDQPGQIGSLSNLYIFSIIALFILLLASINFINLSTARSAERSKEVAVKKIIGAGRTQMVWQFFIESLLTVFISVIVSIIFCYMLLPVFNQFTGKQLFLKLSTPLHISILLLVTLSIALLSGSYPAFILSAFKPINALKGKLNPSAWNIGIRKGLVIFQFAISLVLIISSIVVYHQMQFLQQHDLGFNASQTMVINFEGDHDVQQKMNTIKQELSQIPGVEKISASSNVPGDGSAGGWSMNFALKNGDTIHTELPIYLADFNFLDQYRVPVMAGRALSKDFASDSTESMLINETALKTLGFHSADEAIGVHVGMYPSDGVITGVFKDFHFKSLQSAIEPLILRFINSKFRLLSLKIKTENISKTISSVESKWNSLVPWRPLEYNFLGESFNRQYTKEMKYRQVITLFTALAVVVACLGLFGLALFNTQQRKKEIGIRKVLGAGVATIVSLVSKEFLIPVCIAIVIASPLAWMVMRVWLQNFAYRIDISWWMFVLAGGVAIIMAFLAVSFQSIKAAIANPVDSLRTE